MIQLKYVCLIYACDLGRERGWGSGIVDGVSHDYGRPKICDKMGGRSRSTALQKKNKKEQKKKGGNQPFFSTLGRMR